MNDPSKIKNNSHTDLNDKNITGARFIQVNQLPQIDSHLTAKLFVDNALDELSLVRNNQDNIFGNYNLTNINCITSNKPAKNDNEVITKAYVDQFRQDNERSRRDLGIDFYHESNDVVKNNQDNDFKALITWWQDKTPHRKILKSSLGTFQRTVNPQNHKT